MTTYIIISYILIGILASMVLIRKLDLNAWEFDDCMGALLGILLWPLYIMISLLYLAGKCLIIAANTFPWRNK